VPMTGYPVTVVSTVTKRVQDRIDRHDVLLRAKRRTSRGSIQFLRCMRRWCLPRTRAATLPTNRLRKPYTPSFDVKAVYDTHDDCVDRAVLGHRREARRAPGRIENDFAQPRTYTIDSDDVPAFATEIGREVFGRSAT
jgi:hypothetical protein